MMMLSSIHSTMIRRNLPILRDGKSRVGAIILDSFKRCYPRTNPAPAEKPTDDVDDVEFHSKLADQWWNPLKNPLHALNEVRVPFIRNCLMNSGLIYTSGTNSNTILEGLKVLDVGCGGGILSEALGRLRCDVTGIDASFALIEVAKEHATRDKNVEKHVKYENTDLRSFSRQHPEEFDLVVVSEVLEHVSYKEDFLKMCATCLRDEGSLFITTPNRTWCSKLFLIELAEFLRIVPTGTHDYEKFMTPRELTVLLKNLNCTTKHIEGIMYWPLSRKFEAYYFHTFMYALHAIKNTEQLGLDTFREDNTLRYAQ